MQEDPKSLGQKQEWSNAVQESEGALMSEKQPWLNEPDHLELEFEGFPAIIHRNSLGALCGYIGVPPGHPWHGKHYDEVDARCHGGLTYSNTCQGDICHKAKPGEPDDVWWLGFDCAHGGDFVPRMASLSDTFPEYAAVFLSVPETYRNIPYVTEHCRQLAIQAQRAGVEGQ